MMKVWKIDGRTGRPNKKKDAARCKKIKILLLFFSLFQSMMNANFDRLKFEQLGRDEFELDMDEKAKIEAEAADR